MSDKKTQQKIEEEMEILWLTKHVGFFGYEIVESRCDDRKFDFRIRKNRP